MGKSAKVLPLSSGRILACSIAALLLVGEGLTSAEESLWVGAQSGNWSVPSNWQGGVAPVSGSGSTLRFSATGTSAIIATNDLATPFSIGSLRFENTGSGLFTVTGSALQLTGSSPEIVQAGSGDITLSPPLILDAGEGGAVRISGSGLGNLTLTGPIAETGGSGSLIIAGQSSSHDRQIIELLGENSSTGGITLESGNLLLGSGSIGANNAPLVVKGGSLRLQTGGFDHPINLHSDLLLLSSLSMRGEISSAVAGTGLTVRITVPATGSIPPGNVYLLQPSTYSGATRIDYDESFAAFAGQAAALVLSGDGALPATSQIELRAGAALSITGNLDGGPQDRLNDAAPLKLQSGKLILQALKQNSPVPAPTVPQVETVGPIQAGGHSTITVDLAAGLPIQGEIAAASLQRMEQGTLLLRGIPGGTSPTGQGSRGRVTLAAVPTDLVGGGTGVMTPIVPYAIGDPSPTANSAATGLVTYDPEVGFRLLASSEYSSDLETPGSNVRLSEAMINVLDKTINALVLDSGGLSGSGVLSISTGLVLNSSSSQQGSIDHRLYFGEVDGKIFTRAALSVTGEISGSGGLTKSGEANLHLAGANTFSGPLTINSGPLSFTSPQALGQEGNRIVFDGPDVQLIHSGAANGFLNNEIVLKSGKARLVNQTSLGTLEFSGVISGSGGLFISSGNRSGVIRLTGSNSFGGPVVLEDGELQINSDAALGSGNELTLLKGKLSLLDDWTTSRTIRLDDFNQTTIDTGGFDARLDGKLLGNGWLQKVGPGTLTLSSQHLLLDRITVAGGTLALSDLAGSAVREVSVSTGASLLSDQTAPGSRSHLTADAEVTLLGGEWTIAGRDGALASEKIKSLAVQGSEISTLILAPGEPGGSGAALEVGAFPTNGHGLLIQAADLGISQNRFVVNEPFTLRNGLAIGVFTQAAAGDGEVLTTYDSGLDAAGRIGFRPASTLITQEIRTPINGGTTPESGNIVSREGPTLVHGSLNRINSLTIGLGGSVILEPAQVLRIESGAVLAQSAPGAAIVAGGSLELGGGPATFTLFRDLEISSNLTGSGSLLMLGGGKLTLSGSVSIAGGITVSSGTLRMMGENSYAGATTVKGHLEIDADAALGASSTLTFDRSGASLRLGGEWISSRQVAINSATDFYLDGHGARLESPLQGTGEFRIHGPGELTLAASASYSGTIRLGGDLRLSGTGGILSRSIIASSGALTLDNRAIASSNRLRDDANINRPILTLIGNADVAVTEVVGILSIPSLGVTPGIRLVSAGAPSAILNASSLVATDGVKTIAGDQLGGTGAGFTRLTFRTPPALQRGLLPNSLAAMTADSLPESFAFYDATEDEHGVVGVRAIREAEYDKSAVISGDGILISNNFIAVSGVTVGSGREVVNSLTMRGEGAIGMTPEQTLVVQTGSVMVQSNASAVIGGGRIDLGSTARFIVNGSLAVESALSSTRLEKYGPGTMRLGDVSIGETMSIAEGTLLLAGSVANGGSPLGAPVTTADGTTLAGSGLIAGRVMISGTLSPGNGGVGTIRTHSLTLNPGSAVSFNLTSASAYDRLEVAGALVLGGPVALTLTLGYDPLDFVDAFTLISNDWIDPISLSSSGHFTFAGEPLSEGEHFLAQEQLFQISYAGGDGNDVVLRAVPEPSAALLLLSGFIGFLSKRRRTARLAT